ncbi:hypothetical protein SAMN04488544_0529 [Microlunatus sagamiharensis]|uniref:Transcription regulator PadR N-terminal domain-containing protein n=1 Tax=Microlunatus sagamiharensis TaxID=546874 RepID=A0A1H2LNK1_9ACTN|nr:hypothetical protein [Microlunatus sagamiharensis]SDU82412.1 hypothetical protein SAMN04488544_0529 [Microlunatus sagamiharensis]
MEPRGRFLAPRRGRGPFLSLSKSPEEVGEQALCSCHLYLASDIDPRREGRPARRYYRLTALGAESARAALERVHRPHQRRQLGGVRPA